MLFLVKKFDKNLDTDLGKEFFATNIKTTEMSVDTQLSSFYQQTEAIMVKITGNRSKAMDLQIEDFKIRLQKYFMSNQT